MISRFEVWLNEVALSSIHPDIYIRDIEYTVPTLQDTLHAYGLRNGATPIKRYIGSTTVSVLIEIHTYGTAERQRICEQVAAWAMKGGVLRTSDKNERRLNVVCSDAPTIESALNWTDTVTISFAAYALPFWEDLYPQELKLTGTSETGSMFGVGYADRPFVTVNLAVKAGTLTDVSFVAGSTNIVLSGLSLATGAILTLDYDARHILTLYGNNESVYNKRTASSSDDLRLEIGVANPIVLSANTNVEATFKARGLYL